MSQAASEDTGWRDLAIVSEAPLYLTVTEKKSGRTLGRFDLTAEEASAQLHAVVPTDQRVGLGDMLREVEGGCGDLDEITLGAIFEVADHWISAQQSLLPEDGIHELRLREKGANRPLRAWPLSAPKRPGAPSFTLPRSLDDLGEGYRPVEALQRGMTTVLDGAGRVLSTQEGGHRALDARGAKIADSAHALTDLLHVALSKAEDRAELNHQRALADLKDQQTRHANELARIEERHAAEVARIEALHAKEVTRLDQLLAASEARNAQAEQRLEFLAARVIQVEREGGVEAVEARNREKVAEEVGESVRSLFNLAAKVGLLWTLRDRLSPDLIAAMSAALEQEPEVLKALSDPALAAMLDNPAVQSLLASPETVQALVPLLKDPETLRAALAAAGSPQ